MEWDKDGKKISEIQFVDGEPVQDILNDRSIPKPQETTEVAPVSSEVSDPASSAPESIPESAFEPANASDAKEQPLELESSSEILDPDNSSIENSPAESTDLKPKPIDQEVPQPKLDDDTFAPKAPSPKPLDPFAELEDFQPKASPTKSKMICRLQNHPNRFHLLRPLILSKTTMQ